MFCHIPKLARDRHLATMNRNGGSERCLVINVQDNIDNFNREVAFADLDWLWT